MKLERLVFVRVAVIEIPGCDYEKQKHFVRKWSVCIPYILLEETTKENAENKKGYSKCEPASVDCWLIRYLYF